MIYFLRECDSRNINRSPLCDLSSEKNPQKWSGRIMETYGEFDSLDYVIGMKNATRHLYPTENMRKNEIVTILSKVYIIIKLCIT